MCEDPHHSSESCWRDSVCGNGESSSETMDASTLFQDLLSYCAWIGLAVVVLYLPRIVFGVLGWLKDCIFSLCGSQKDLPTVYGQWAVVTGSTDGIGKGYAIELARRGMNICLISRNENKLINVASEIRTLFPVSVRWIKADFGNTDMYDHIEKELSTLEDIGILVNNVGITPDKSWEAFCNHERELLLNTININMTSLIMMTQIILKFMIPKNRGLIVNVGSLSSLVPLPYGALYSSTKIFLDNFSLCLATELSSTGIDVQCLRPGFVRTNLLAHMKALTNFYDKILPFLLPDVETFTKSAIKSINGSVPLYTCGYWAHSLTVMQYFERDSSILVLTSGSAINILDKRDRDVPLAGGQISIQLY